MNSISLSQNGSHSQQTSNVYTGFRANISTTEDLVKKALSLFKLELFARVKERTVELAENNEQDQEAYDFNVGIQTFADKVLTTHKSTFETNILSVDDSSDHCFFLYSLARIILKNGPSQESFEEEGSSQFKSYLFTLKKYLKNGLNLSTQGKVAEAAL